MAYPLPPAAQQWFDDWLKNYPAGQDPRAASRPDVERFLGAFGWAPPPTSDWAGALAGSPPPVRSPGWTPPPVAQTGRQPRPGRLAGTPDLYGPDGLYGQLGRGVF